MCLHSPSPSVLCVFSCCCCCCCRCADAGMLLVPLCLGCRAGLASAPLPWTPRPKAPTPARASLGHRPGPSLHQLRTQHRDQQAQLWISPPASPWVLHRSGVFAVGLGPRNSASARGLLAFACGCGVLELCPLWGCIGRDPQLAGQLRPRPAPSPHGRSCWVRPRPAANLAANARSLGQWHRPQGPPRATELRLALAVRHVCAWVSSLHRTCL